MYAEYRIKYTTYGDIAWQRVSQKRFSSLEAAKSACRRHFNKSCGHMHADYRVISAVRGAVICIAHGKHEEMLRWKNIC